MQNRNRDIPGSQLPGSPMWVYYCLAHDVGVLVLAEHDVHTYYSPLKWLSKICCHGGGCGHAQLGGCGNCAWSYHGCDHGCGNCAWRYHGEIREDGTNTIEPQYIFDSYCGGWKVSNYGDIEVYDIDGNLVWESFNWIRISATDICIAMQDLELPAIITLEILDQLFPQNAIRMWAKWELITAVKHFHQRRASRK
jgi:hypothetical protein